MVKRFEGWVNERTSQTDLDYVFDRTPHLGYYNRVFVTLMYCTCQYLFCFDLSYVDIFALDF